MQFEQWPEQHPASHRVVDAEQSLQPCRQHLVPPDRLVVAFGIVKRIGQALIRVMAQMQRPKPAERIDQADRQAHQQLVDALLGDAAPVGQLRDVDDLLGGDVDQPVKLLGGA